MTISVGVDVGGTFTDFLMLDSASGAFATAKVPTTVDDRAKGFLQGLAELGVSPAEVGWLVLLPVALVQLLVVAVVEVV